MPTKAQSCRKAVSAQQKKAGISWGHRNKRLFCDLILVFKAPLFNI